MADLLLDSTIVIDYLRGNSVTSAYLDDVKRFHGLYTHPVVILEVLEGARNAREQQWFAEVVASMKPVSVLPSDWDRAIEIFKSKRLSHGLGWPDALIAATSLRLAQDVVTLNEKHFRAIAGLRVVRPY